MPFLPAAVNVLLYFAGYTSLQRYEIFGALSLESRKILFENDVELATYAWPLNGCPSEHETMTFITDRLEKKCCNQLFRGLPVCTHDCVQDTQSHRFFVQAIGKGVHSAVERCESGRNRSRK